MKLFIWHKVLQDYGWGVAYAMAETEEEAREVILKEYAEDFPPDKYSMYSRFKAELENQKAEVHDTSYGYWLDGSA